MLEIAAWAVLIAGILASGAMATKRIRKKCDHECDHECGKYGEPYSYMAQHAGLYDGTFDGPPFKVTQQDRRCDKCGIIEAKRIWL